MFETSVELGIAAFCQSERPRTVAEVHDVLRGQGVQPGLAQRLVIFLPIAFGRLLLSGFALTDSFLDGAEVRPLDSEGVYIAARDRAQHASRLEVERIGLTSPEVSAVNQALNNGSRPEDLVFGPIALAEPLEPLAG